MDIDGHSWTCARTFMDIRMDKNRTCPAPKTDGRGTKGSAARASPRDAAQEPAPARRVSTIVNSAARIPHLAHPKLRTAPREGAAPRGPDRGHGEHVEPFKNQSRA